jgi:hypothetical protein
MSKRGSNPTIPLSIPKQGYTIRLERIESKLYGVYITFMLVVKTQSREKSTEQNPGINLDFSFYFNGDNKWDWNAGLTKEAFSRQYGCSNIQYDSIKQDAYLKRLTDEGILHTFDIGLSVLSGIIVFHNNSHSCLKLFVFVEMTFIKAHIISANI